MGQTPKKKKAQTPKKNKLLSGLKSSAGGMQSPGGPTAVRTSSFQLIAVLPVNMNIMHKTHFTLDKVRCPFYLHVAILCNTKT